MNIRLQPLILFCFASYVTVAPSAAAGETVRVTNRDELVRALRDVRPGTTIAIAGGNYRGGLSQVRLRGTKEQPIVLAAADPADPPVIEGGLGLHLSAPAYLELRDLVISKSSGNGLNIDDGGSDSAAHHVVLKNVVVRDVGPDGNRDGIKLSGVDDFTIENCRVERWGKSGSAIDMVGCHRGLIEGCTFAEGTSPGANGVQAKGGSSQIVIRRCRFDDCGGRAINVGGSTGLAFIRPRDADYEAKEITVNDCTIVGGMAAIAFVGVDGALVQHNTIYRPTRWAIRILQENTDPRFVPSRRGTFKNNILVFRASEIGQVVNISPQTAPDTFTFTGNHWHCLDRPADTRRLLDLPVEETGGIHGQLPRFKDAEKGDFSIPDRKPDEPGARSALPAASSDDR